MTTMQMLTRRPMRVSPAETESRPALVPRNGDELSVTTRQRQVLQLICDGCRTKEIALQLGISTRTVEHHKYAMMHQLNMRTTAELAAHAVRQKLVS